ncbi:MAG TPA: Arm DNA-binding domain-containing protein, partial [Mycobacterium sp.]|nr:Arm DNA-binding domain-containing protein [Mycobacterium sp.]
MNRRAQTRGGRGYVPGVYQRCHRDCPADRCRNPRHTWYYTVEVAAAGGKRRQFSKGGFETATEAVKARAEVVRQHREGTLPADPRRTLDSWLREWLDGKVRRGEIEGSTERGYRDNIDHYLIPKLGRCKLGELRGLHITRAYGEIVAERQAEIEAAEAKNAKYEAEAETL